MDWRVHWVIATAKRYLPFADRLRAAKRRLRPYQTDRSMDEGLLHDGLRLVAALHAAGVPVAGARALEIGTGWNPLLPLLFVVSGARSVAMTDIERLLDAGLLRAAARQLLGARARVEAAIPVVPGGFEPLEAALARPEGEALDALCAVLRLAYLAPFDLDRAEAGSVDISFSRATLEHIPKPELRAIFAGLRRLAAPGGGVTIHLTDHSDHRWHRDKSLTPLDFLKYGDAAWAVIDLRRRHNRLRCSEIAALLAGEGWAVRRVETGTTEDAVRALANMRLATRYAAFDRDDLAALSSVVLADGGGDAAVGRAAAAAAPEPARG